MREKIVDPEDRLTRSEESRGDLQDIPYFIWKRLNDIETLYIDCQGKRTSESDSDTLYLDGGVFVKVKANVVQSDM